MAGGQADPWIGVTMGHETSVTGGGKVAAVVEGQMTTTAVVVEVICVVM